MLLTPSLMGGITQAARLEKKISRICELHLAVYSDLVSIPSHTAVWDVDTIRHHHAPHIKICILDLATGYTAYRAETTENNARNYVLAMRHVRYQGGL